MKLRILVITFIVITFLSASVFYVNNNNTSTPLTKKELKEITKKARNDYFFNMLRDPKTNSIPKNIREKELEFSTNVRDKANLLQKSNATAFEWSEAGPIDVGGRTRALAVDRTNSNTILVGGASGGIWKSTDGGSSWKMKTHGQQLSVTFITQDYSDPKTWYYTSGEFNGSASDNIGSVAPLYGSGFYRSSDNGETWIQLQDGGSDVAYDSYYDYISKVIVNPVTGSVFIACHNYGILKSTDKGVTFNPVLGQLNDHYYAEMDIHSTGYILATLSYGGNNTPQNTPGVYLSADDGETWSPIITSDIAESYVDPSRQMIAFAPSNVNVAYLWTDYGDETRFYKLNFTEGLFYDRTENLPDFGDPVGGVNTQGSYNMILAVKPDDENFVIFGATNLFRSFDGFATPATDKFTNWIGGYDIENNINQYPNHHPDNHSLFFDPQNPNKLWSGHDGGLSYTENITVNNSRINWIDKNRSYNVTQFYHASIAQQANDPLLIGGTQDNGSPTFMFDGEEASNSTDASSGDGAFSYIGENRLYSSAQTGYVLRMDLIDGVLDPGSWAYVYPSEAENKLFIHPYTIDPSDENIMYYPDGNKLWRNTSISTIEGGDEGTTDGWSDLGAVDGLDEATHRITALAVSHSNPMHVLYIGLSSGYEAPIIIRLINSNYSSAFTEISIPDVPGGSYLSNIAVNPEDANEIIVTFSNYNIASLYRSTDGGNSYTTISGNLDGENGPSIRAVTILPFNGTTNYFTATSIGVFSTTSLNASNTTWNPEGNNEIGNVVTAYITSRISDGKVVAATHGRGIFAAIPDGAVDVRDDGQLVAEFKLDQNYPNPFNPSTTIDYVIPNASGNVKVQLKVFNSIGQEIATLINKSQFEGNYSINWNAETLPSGIYFYTLSSGKYSQTKKMLLLK